LLVEVDDFYNKYFKNHIKKVDDL